MGNYDKELKQIKKFLLKSPRGLTISEISKKLNINRNSVAKYLDVLTISGNAEMRSIGPAKVFFTSHRVPLSAMLDFSSDYILVFDKDLKILHANDNILDFMKVERNVLLGQGIEDSPHSFLKNPKIISKIKKALEGKDSTIETSFKLAGKELYFRVKVIPTTFEDKESGVTIMLEDITKHKETNKALQESKKRYHTLFDTAPVGIGIADLKGNVIDGNKCILEMTGYTLKELNNIGLENTYFNQDDRKKLIKTLQKYGKVRDFEVRLKRKDSRIYYALLNIDYVELDGQKVLLTTARDITERKKAEERLCDSEEKLRRIFDSSPNSITITSLNGKIIGCNQETLDMHGYSSKDELIGKKAFELIAKKDHERAMKNMKKTLKQGSVKNIEYTLLTKDRREFLAELSASVVRDISGNPTSFVAITKDITKQKKAEERLRDSEERYRNLVGKMQK